TLEQVRLLRALRQPPAWPWVFREVSRGLQAPGPGHDGPLRQRGQGGPQGGGIRPILAHLCWPEAFDAWRQRAHPSSPFERYADALSAQGQSAAPARWLQARLAPRLAQCHRDLPPTTPHMVYGTDAARRGSFPQERVAGLGSPWCPRRSK